MVYTIIIFLSIVVFGFLFQWNNYKKQERIREEPFDLTEFVQNTPTPTPTPEKKKRVRKTKTN